jgi:hypothetical protein
MWIIFSRNKYQKDTEQTSIYISYIKRIGPIIELYDLGGKQHRFDFKDNVKSEIIYDFILDGIRNKKDFLEFNLLES